jgi:hypothetical protein
MTPLRHHEAIHEVRLRGKRGRSAATQATILLRRRAHRRHPIRWRNWRKGLTLSCIRRFIRSWDRTGTARCRRCFSIAGARPPISALWRSGLARSISCSRICSRRGAPRPLEGSGSDGSGLQESRSGERICRKHSRGDRSREYPPSGEVNQFSSSG